MTSFCTKFKLKNIDKESNGIKNQADNSCKNLFSRNYVGSFLACVKLKIVLFDIWKKIDPLHVLCY